MKITVNMDELWLIILALITASADEERDLRTQTDITPEQVMRMRMRVRLEEYEILRSRLFSEYFFSGDVKEEEVNEKDPDKFEHR